MKKNEFKLLKNKITKEIENYRNDMYKQQSEFVYKHNYEISVFEGIGASCPWSGDEPPMIACGGNFIGGEIRRNKQCPHEADLRRLSLRNWGRRAPN